MAEVIAFRPRQAAESGWGICPWSETFTEYDRKNLSLFARLLHDEAEGAGLFDLARDVFELSPWLKPQRVRAIVRSHLRRAHWVADNFFPILGR
jgi:hypothetical protein